MASTTPLLLSLFLLVSANPQSPVTVEKEPRHRLRFENRHVRVFDVLIPQGDASLFHIHEHDGIGIKLTDALIRDEKFGGKPEELQVQRGVVSFSHFPEALTHRVSNVGTTPFRNMFIEILPSTSAPGDVPSTTVTPGHAVVLENGRVRVSRRVLAPGRSTDSHTHALRCLAVAVTDGEISRGAPGEESKTLHIKQGDSVWLEAGTMHSLKNVGTAPFEAVDIELK
jgi:quercetin dioxygenase-like cupin family protein